MVLWKFDLVPFYWNSLYIGVYYREYSSCKSRVGASVQCTEYKTNILSCVTCNIVTHLPLFGGSLPWNVRNAIKTLHLFGCSGCRLGPLSTFATLCSPLPHPGAVFWCCWERQYLESLRTCSDPFTLVWGKYLLDNALNFLSQPVLMTCT